MLDLNIPRRAARREVADSRAAADEQVFTANLRVRDVREEARPIDDRAVRAKGRYHLRRIGGKCIDAQMNAVVEVSVPAAENGLLIGEGSECDAGAKIKKNTVASLP
jgi:hypothetical protein